MKYECNSEEHFHNEQILINKWGSDYLSLSLSNVEDAILSMNPIVCSILSEMNGYCQRKEYLR